jgi:hypothetical protein
MESWQVHSGSDSVDGSLTAVLLLVWPELQHTDICVTVSKGGTVPLAQMQWKSSGASD